MESAELMKLREFNESKNEARKRREEKEKELEREGKDSSSEDDVDEDEEEKEKEKEAPKLIEPQKGPVVDDDGFEVVTKKGGRRK